MTTLKTDFSSQAGQTSEALLSASLVLFAADTRRGFSPAAQAAVEVVGSHVGSAERAGYLARLQKISGSASSGSASRGHGLAASSTGGGGTF